MVTEHTPNYECVREIRHDSMELYRAWETAKRADAHVQTVYSVSATPCVAVDR